MKLQKRGMGLKRFWNACFLFRPQPDEGWNRKKRGLYYAYRTALLFLSLIHI